MKLCDPFGHTGFTQEAPLLVLSLLSDMLQLTWVPMALRSADSKQPKSPSVTTKSDSSGCLGHCMAPAPVPSFPSTNVPVQQTPVGASLAAFALHTITPTAPAPAPPDYCAYCQDVSHWFEMTSRLCQHVAPVAPPALPRLELTVESINTTMKRPGC